MEELINTLINYLKGHKGICAIDGRCLSGKTTLAEILNKGTGIPYISLDDFFLQPYQRTKERYETPGENIDYERILEEVVIPFKEGRDIYYRPFDCSKMELSKEKFIKNTGSLILEGSYSFNIHLVGYYDTKVFLDITTSLQIERLKKRENGKQVENFINKWIPLEEKYIEAFKPQDKADFYFETK